MKMPQEEVEAETKHVHALLRRLNERRRVLEQKEAQKGIDTNAEIVTELAELKDKIEELQNRDAELETLAVEDTFSYSEAEYRVKLAQAWDTPQGWPTTYNKAQLELDRLRLRVPPERAQQLEREIRIELAQQFLSLLDTRYIALSHDDIQTDDQAKKTMDIIVRAIRLDPPTVFSAIHTCIRSQTALVNGLQDVLAWGVWPHKEDRALFKKFVRDLEEAIAVQTVEPKGILDTNNSVTESDVVA